MELQNLTYFVLTILLVGLIAGVGVLVLDKFGTTVYDSTLVLNETHAFSSNVLTVDNIDQGISGVSIGNSSVTYGCLLAGSANCNYTTAGVITGSQDIGDDSISVNYTYKANSSTTTAAHAARVAVAEIPSSWMSLIVTIGILAVILGLVLSAFSFTKGKDR